MYGEKPRLPLLLMPSRANRCDSHVSPGFYHIYATDYLIEASMARHIGAEKSAIRKGTANRQSAPSLVHRVFLPTYFQTVVRLDKSRVFQ